MYPLQVGKKLYQHWRSGFIVPPLEVRNKCAAIGGQEESPRLSTPNFLHPLLRSGNSRVLYVVIGTQARFLFGVRNDQSMQLNATMVYFPERN
jgi:hypothetical protein